MVGSEQGHRRRPAFLQATPERGMGGHPEAPGQGQGFLVIRIAHGSDLQARKPCQQIRHVLPEAAASHDRNRHAVHELDIEDPNRRGNPCGCPFFTFARLPRIGQPQGLPLRSHMEFGSVGSSCPAPRPALTCLRSTSIMSGSVRQCQQAARPLVGNSSDRPSPSDRHRRKGSIHLGSRP